MNIDAYIKNLQKGAGTERALKIAERCMNSTKPENWSHIPHGDIFFPTDSRQKTGYKEADLRKLHNWWTYVYYIMKKGVK